jgi:polyvinyl alcohol dehydrogenase (cytochrome)
MRRRDQGSKDVSLLTTAGRLARIRDMKWLAILVGAVAASIVAIPLLAQAPPGPQRLFETRCMTCHGNPNAAAAPAPTALRLMVPDAILAALASRAIHAQGDQLTEAQKRGIAEYLAGRNLTGEGVGDAASMPNRCATSDPIRSITATPAWNGWGSDLTNARFQTAGAARLTTADVTRLKVKWAFGLPGATMVYGQPTVVAGRVFVSGNTGYVYSLDAKSGCVYWSFQAQSAVRTATTVGPIKGEGANRFAAYFGDQRAFVYAVDASSGKLLWKRRVDDHGLAGITGAPTLYDGRLYVPVSSREEPAGVATVYPCCTFRGSVVALDGDTGKQIWKTNIISEDPKPTKKNSRGVQLYAPSGGGIWDTPTIDEARGALYIGTGDAYSRPVSALTTDAVMALDLATGKPRWAVQHTPDDAWLVGCETNNPSENCPANIGPDWDFGDSPIMRTLNDGRTIVVSGQKSGDVFAQDVRDGKVLWKATLVDKLARGEITFGGAADDQQAYFGTRSGAVWALDLKTGEKKWSAKIAPIPQRQAGQTAALTVIPGVVFSGGSDGVLRAFATGDGKQVWEFDTVRDFTTANGVAGKGGAMGAPGPTIAGGMMFVGSGYTGLGNGRGGNVLLAFEAAEGQSTR